MQPRSHFIISTFIGASIWVFTKSLSASLLCFISGTLLDLDHIIEYIIQGGCKDLTYKQLCLACQQTRIQEGKYQFKKMFLIFHSNEIAISLWLITFYTKNIYCFAGTLGYSAHLILDYIGNTGYWHSYFVVSRIINDFNTNKLLRKFIQKNT